MECFKPSLCVLQFPILILYAIFQRSCFFSKRELRLLATISNRSLMFYNSRYVFLHLTQISSLLQQKKKRFNLLFEKDWLWWSSYTRHEIET